MRSRGLIVTIALVVLASLAMVAAVGPAVLAPADQPTASPAPVAQATAQPAAQPSAEPGPTDVAVPNPSPSPSPSIGPTLAPVVLQSMPPDWEIYPSRTPGYPILGLPPGGLPAPLPPGSSGAVASRVVFASRNIDLPIVSGTHHVRGNRGNYPLCDVAQYLEIFVQPGEEGTTYIYAHAQRGMFLPMLRASQRQNGREMLGQRVEVYTTASKLFIYEVTRINRHSTDLNIGWDVPVGEQRLILQTSEGPHGHRPVLQVQAELVAVEDSTPAESMPTPRPRVCLPPR